ncbi:hypothetical protein VNO77_16181 [Canavalia gladiata]|uniref:Uncharacterized protein n=1 Tax=Canavalia gladiata TaxID=3824 RepID=A0AAN9QSW2_CANGL
MKTMMWNKHIRCLEKYLNESQSQSDLHKGRKLVEEAVISTINQRGGGIQETKQHDRSVTPLFLSNGIIGEESINQDAKLAREVWEIVKIWDEIFRRSEGKMGRRSTEELVIVNIYAPSELARKKEW